MGEWTLVPFIPIPPGDHVFSAIATLPDGTQVESDEVLIVSIPEPDAEDESVLAFLVPREGEGGKILQKPTPKVEEVDLAAEDEVVEPAPKDEEIEMARLPDPTADEPGADAADEETAPTVADEEATPAATDEETAPATAEETRACRNHRGRRARGRNALRTRGRGAYRRGLGGL